MIRPPSAQPPASVETIPGVLNVGIALSAAAGAIVSLWAASQGSSAAVTVLAVVAFSFLGNTLFSCLHECVHGVFHPSRAINELFGIACAAFFPTGLSLQRAAHMGHHRRNRSEEERFDYYAPADSRFLKFVQWYGIISGIYWIVAVLGWLIYLLLPIAFRRSAQGDRWSDLAEHTSGPAYARSFASAPPVRARVELVFTILFQMAIFRLFDLSVTGWLLCYLAFGFQWSALQYADHAFSRLDVVEGAWDLRVHPIVQALFLNYHLHLAHHRSPTTPWIHLPRRVDPTRHRPRFVAHYLRMWLGPRPLPPAG